MIVQLVERIKLLEEQLAYTALRAAEMRALLRDIADSGIGLAAVSSEDLLMKLYPEEYKTDKPEGNE